MSKPTYRWKFLDLSEDGQIVSAHDKSTWTVGEWRTTTKQPKNCKSGFHCSRTLSQAFGYVQSAVVAKVEVAGKADIADDKESWQEMRIVQAWEWDKIASVKLAIYAAKQVIDIYEAKYPDDSRPRDAIKAAKRYLRNPSPDAADAAAYAAADAARAAYAAAYAARAADAAAYAARAADAAADAARAAYAARATTIVGIGNYMKRQIKTLKEIQ